MVLEPGAGDLLAVVQVFRADEADHRVDQQRPRRRARRRRRAPRWSAGRRRDAHRPTARCPGRSRNTSRCRRWCRAAATAPPRAPRRSSASETPKLRVRRLGAGDRLEHQIDRRAALDRAQRGGDMRQHAGLRRDRVALAHRVQHVAAACSAASTLSVAGLTPITASPAPSSRPSSVEAATPCGSSVGWFGCSRTDSRPGRPMVLRKRVTTRHFAATAIRSCRRMSLLTAAAISGVRPGRSAASAAGSRAPAASRGSRRRSGAATGAKAARVVACRRSAA